MVSKSSVHNSDLEPSSGVGATCYACLGGAPTPPEAGQRTSQPWPRICCEDGKPKLEPAPSAGIDLLLWGAIVTLIAYRMIPVNMTAAGFA